MTKFQNYESHFFHSIPSGGLIGTRSFAISPQLVLRTVPPLSIYKQRKQELTFSFKFFHTLLQRVFLCTYKTPRNIDLVCSKKIAKVIKIVLSNNHIQVQIPNLKKKIKIEKFLPYPNCVNCKSKQKCYENRPPPLWLPKIPYIL